MRKLIVAAGVLCAVILAAPAPASAHASFFLSLGLPLPEFSFFVAPSPPPFAYYPRRTYYAAPVASPYCHRHYRGRRGFYGRGYYRGYGY